ncbi:MAG: tail fiber domain-containing protein [Lewinellaceae bacterium]|nr:tail fiber domain-containing protein [Lewinellaceae bacterium]
MRPFYPVALFLLLAPAFAGAQAISINTDSSNPDPSAILDVKSTDKGMLVPRMTTAQRTMIAAPATGLLVFDTTTGGFWFYNGTVWMNLSGGGTPATFIADTDNDTKVQVEKNPDEDIIRFDLGGTQRFVMNGPRLEVRNSGNSVFIGVGAGANDDLSDNRNVALGDSALYSNNTGSNNTAYGKNALRSNTTGDFNTANGVHALHSNTTGFSNIAIGMRALYSNTDRSNLVAVGDSALYNNGTGVSESYHAIANTAVGSKALYSNTTGYQNTANGNYALYSNTNGDYNTANGNYALTSNTSGGGNTANGSSALFSNITGNFNTANGLNALYSNTTGNNNTANGLNALRFNTTGNFNTANGLNALYSNTTGSGNTANGTSALEQNTTGFQNTANGNQALRSNTTGSNNTAIGTIALSSNTTGSWNTANGIFALYSNTTGVYNSALGYFADVASAALTNATAIGTRAEVGASNCLVLGSISGVNGATASVNVGIGTTTPDVRLHIEGGSDVEPAGGGHFVLGPVSGSNIAMDDNEIMARNNGAAANLILNNEGGKVGIGRTPTTRILEVDGEASKATTGDWYANSDARLKKNITPLNSQLMLQNLLALQGVTYEWNDDKTDWNRPEGVQYGFTAQNIQTVFPTLVEEDKLGYLQTAYGTYDAMTVEAIRALHDKITALEAENTGQKALIDLQKKQLDMQSAQLNAQSTQLQQITAALQTAGIGVGN